MSLKPLPHESNIRTTVYIDESSTTKYHYLVIGGLIIPKDYAARLEQDIIDARGTLLPVSDDAGEARVIKWQKAKGHDHLIGYSKVIDAFFRFPQKHKMPVGLSVDINCIAVDLTKKDDKQYSDGDADIGFNKEINFLCVKVIGRKHRNSLFDVYPDRRTTKQSLLTAQNIMNYSAAKYPDEKRFLPFQRLEWGDPENFQALQVVDIVIGAIAYKLNRHYEAQDANKTKRALCDHVMKWAKITNVFRNTDIWRRRVTIFHRNYSPFRK